MSITRRSPRRLVAVLTMAAALSITAACGGATTTTPGATGSSAAPAPSGGGSGQLTLLFGSSGQTETDALTAATQAWSATSGTAVTVTPAQQLVQQLAQGFASGQSPDVFYVGADQFANFAQAGNLWPYGDQLSNAADYYPALKDSFTYDGQFYCAPKDFSTLALYINTDLWAAAGLTDADIPTTWDQLATVAGKLTSGAVTGLSINPSSDRLDAFLVQNGGYLVDDAGMPTADSEQNVQALTYLKDLLSAGSLKFPKDVGAGDTGEAFGKGLAAMTVDGNWAVGGLAKDYPDVKYTVAELPAGPSGDRGTLSFTNCWGIAATSANKEAAKSLVEYLTTKDQQLAFAKAFAVLPSLQSAKADYLSQFPANAPFVAGVDYARGVVSAPGVTDVLSDFNAQLEGLATASPQEILGSVQQNLTAAIGG